MLFCILSCYYSIKNKLTYNILAILTLTLVFISYQPHVTNYFILALAILFNNLIKNQNKLFFYNIKNFAIIFIITAIIAVILTKLLTNISYRGLDKAGTIYFDKINLHNIFYNISIFIKQLYISF